MSEGAHGGGAPAGAARVVEVDGWEVRVPLPERLAWRLVALDRRPLADQAFDPALHAEPITLAGFGAAGPLTQYALVARDRIRAALAPRAAEISRAGFALDAPVTSNWTPAPKLAWDALLDARAPAWAAFELAAAGALAAPSGDAQPAVTVPAASYTQHLRQLAYASLGLPAPGDGASIAGERMGFVGDVPPTVTMIDPDVAAEPLGGFALAQALGVRRLRAAAQASAGALQLALPPPAAGHPRALAATTVGEALTELEETLVGAAVRAGLPDGMSWDRLPFYDAPLRARAAARFDAYLSRWRRVTDARKGVVAPGDGDDYRVLRDGAAMLGWTLRAIDVHYAQRPEPQIVAGQGAGKRQPSLAWGLKVVYAPVPVYASAPAGKLDGAQALRARLAGAATIAAAVEALAGGARH